MQTASSTQIKGRFERNNQHTPRHRTKESLERGIRTREENKVAKALVEKTAGDIVAIARSACEPALRFLVEIVEDPERDDHIRMEAAKTILQRGHVDAARIGAVTVLDASHNARIPISREAILRAARQALEENVIDVQPETE